MCGRYSLGDAERQRLGERFLLALEALGAVDVRPRYNIAPSQFVLTVVAGPGGQRRPVLMRWGLTPSWSRDGRPGPINARAETAASKPMFRTGLRRFRCIIPADGFFEWRPEPAGGKTPMRFTVGGGELFAFAGISERWVAPDGSALWSCAILTTAPNDLVRPVHDRMPVILRPEHERLWLDPELADPDALAPAWTPYPAAGMAVTRVSSRVNSPRNDDAECIRPVA